MINNIETYKRLLDDILQTDPGSPGDDIAGELLGVKVIFDPNNEHLPAIEQYVNAEMRWYLSQDLNIKGHAGIEDNKIWRTVASPDGNVNSNYGWCVYSSENYDQFHCALRAICDNIFTKRASMIYSRPSIHFDWNDDVHAHKDAICTIYTQVEIRMVDNDYVMDYHVHMRSNDAWYGMRNDYRWHVFVMKELARRVELKTGKHIKLGFIRWFADSLHIYKWAVPTVKAFLEGDTNENSGI